MAKLVGWPRRSVTTISAARSVSSASGTSPAPMVTPRPTQPPFFGMAISVFSLSASGRIASFRSQIR
jgi:hypothetical protein